MSNVGVEAAFYDIIEKAVKNQKDEGFDMPNTIGNMPGQGSITLNARSNSTTAY